MARRLQVMHVVNIVALTYLALPKADQTLALRPAAPTRSDATCHNVVMETVT
jgi:hypothetical protein